MSMERGNAPSSSTPDVFLSSASDGMEETRARLERKRRLAGRETAQAELFALLIRDDLTALVKAAIDERLAGGLNGAQGVSDVLQRGDDGGAIVPRRLVIGGFRGALVVE